MQKSANSCVFRLEKSQTHNSSYVYDVTLLKISLCSLWYNEASIIVLKRYRRWS